ncbi:MAG: PDZ domain-containing protein, partial [Usitatibacteraceae bacterium]
KYYRQDENSPNAIVSYYQKGSIVGMALDLTLRHRTEGAKSLDDVMRALWKEYGCNALGVPEGGVEAIAEKVTGLDLQDFFSSAVHGTADIDLNTLFGTMAIDVAWKIPGKVKDDDPVPATIGAKFGTDASNDVIIAVDGLRVSASSIEKRLRAHPVGTSLAITAFRRDELLSFKVSLQAQPAQTCSLTMQDTPISAKARRNAWLQGR